MYPAGIDDVLAPLSWDAFYAGYWGRRHVRIPGTIAKLDGLTSWAELNAALETHRLPASRLTVGDSQGAEVIETRPDRCGHDAPHLNVALLHEEIRAGRSLVLFQADEILPRVKQLASALGRHFLARVAIHAGASGDRSQRLGARRDAVDQLILQVSGSRRWHLFGAARELPTTPLDEVTLAPGDVLYLPRRHWHDVSCVGESSLHLTCQIDALTGASFIKWLAEELCDDVTFRADLPRFATPAEQRAHVARLRELVVERWNEDLLRGYLHHHVASLEPRRRASLPHAAAADGLPSGDRFMLASNLATRVDARCEGDEVVFGALGREWRLDAGFAGLVRRLLDQGPWHFAELVAESPEAAPHAVRTLAAEFLACGMIHVVEGGEGP